MNFNISFKLFLCMVVASSSTSLRGVSSTLETYGKLKTIHCPNGANTTCHSGTIGCVDNSTTFCHHHLNDVGHIKHIHCGNMSMTCPSGVQDCYDDSNTFCNVPGKATHIFCGNKTSSISCYAGTYGCYNQSAVYCH